MESNNPVLRRTPQFQRGGYAGFDQVPTGTSAPRTLEEAYAAPSATPAHTGRMTYDDVVVRTAGVLATVVAGAAVGWFAPPGFWVLGALAGFVLGLVNSFKREPSPLLILAYGAFEGLFLGGISHQFESLYGGIVVQAVLSTMATFAVMLALYRSGAIRATPRFRKIVLGAVLGYAVFSLINFAFVVFGGGLDTWNGGLGLLVGGAGAVLAALTLVLDFDVIERGVRGGIPQRYAWTAAFGLVVSLVWLYIEFLRILSILRGSD